jgi:Rrf2 family iron-sulfur cluster assembly transcriptional regulator
MTTVIRHERHASLLDRTSEYALRALAVLVALSPGESMRARELAERTGVPPEYLAKVLRRLVAHGILAGKKGHGGGFSLAKPARTIRVADVLEALGTTKHTERCAFGWGKCKPAKPCPLHPMWSKLSESFRSWCSETTLADVDLRRGMTLVTSP